jgi:hypothetical protein
LRIFLQGGYLSVDESKKVMEWMTQVGNTLTTISYTLATH